MGTSSRLSSLRVLFSAKMEFKYGVSGCERQESTTHQESENRYGTVSGEPTEWGERERERKVRE